MIRRAKTYPVVLECLKIICPLVRTLFTPEQLTEKHKKRVKQPFCPSLWEWSVGWICIRSLSNYPAKRVIRWPSVLVIQNKMTNCHRVVNVVI